MGVAFSMDLLVLMHKRGSLPFSQYQSEGWMMPMLPRAS